MTFNLFVLLSIMLFVTAFYGTLKNVVLRGKRSHTCVSHIIDSVEFCRFSARMSHRKFEHPRHGSLGFLPRKRASRHRGKGF